MMPDEPHLQGDSVFSVHQTDIIFYGSNLEVYLRREFGLDDQDPGFGNEAPIRFWDVDRFQEVRWRTVLAYSTTARACCRRRRLAWPQRWLLRPGRARRMT